ncbi:MULTISPECIES: hypothetical protein [Flavobacterium]|uniref:Uncharacterized protein n=1 Tax=Flavobacterium jumunjinense TaxID=998845 RepID=A0ABV5GKE6_9FLAO|nr:MULTISPECIES: hypothetical protein [Flavobacterium]
MEVKELVLKIINNHFYVKIKNIEQAYYYFTGVGFFNMEIDLNFTSFFKDFREYIIDNYYSSYSHFEWHSIIRHQCSNDIDSLDILKRLLLEYIDKR